MTKSREPRTYVLVTGSRDWEDDYIIGIFIHGLRAWHGINMHLFYGCARGADTIAYKATLETNGWVPHPFPADWDQYGKAAGSIRNQKMLDAMIKEVKRQDVVLAIAFKDDLRHMLDKGGTEDMIRRCQKADIPIYHIERL